MADNTLQQENKSIATEDIGGHQIQRVKTLLGTSGVDGGNLSVDNQMPVIDESILIARGLVTGKSHVHIFGANPTIQTATPENIWAAGGLYVFPPAAETFNIVSTSQADNGTTATGALTVLITGLDAAWLETTETLTLNGTTPVVTASMTSIHRIEVLTVGSGLSNAGVITATGNTSALVIANIAIGKNATSLGIYMVPAGKTAYMEKITLAATKVKDTAALITGQFKLFGAGNAFRPVGELGIDSSGLVYEFTTPPALPAKTQLKFLTDVLTNGTGVSMFMELLLVDD